MLPTFQSYGKYESSNYGAHAMQVFIGTLTLYYSYRTVIAYHDYQDGLVISENIWGTTTGKHLNWINPDHSKRVPHDEFTKKLAAAVERHTN